MSSQEGSQERAAIIEALRKEAEAKLGRFAQHGAYLEELQECYGFDLDVAHKVYGDTLLHADHGEAIVHRWGKLLADIADNPGKPLVILDKQPGGIQHRHTIAARRDAHPDFSDRYFAVGIPSVTLGDFVYRSSANTNVIGLRYTQLLQTGTPSKNSRRFLVAPVEGETQEPLLLGYSGQPGIKPQIDLESQHITIAYNPSEKELADIATASSLFDVVFEWSNTLRGADTAAN